MNNTLSPEQPGASEGLGKGDEKGTARSPAKERTSKGKEKKAERKDRKVEKRMRFILPGTIGQRRKSLLNWQKLSKVLYQAAGAALHFVYSRSLANSEPQWAASFAYKSTSRWMLRCMIQTQGFLPRGMGIKSKIARVSYNARYAPIKYCWRVESANHSFLRPLFRLIKPSFQSSTSPIQTFFVGFDILHYAGWTFSESRAMCTTSSLPLFLEIPMNAPPSWFFANFVQDLLRHAWRAIFFE